MRERPLHICIIGGGFTGAAAAIACLGRIAGPFRLSVVEPAAMLGRGVAYGAHHPLHLLNVRTRDLSVRAGQPGDFLNWAFRQLDQGENHAGLHEGLAHTFLPRQLFGEYVRQRLLEAVESRQDVSFHLVKDAAHACFAKAGHYLISLHKAPPIRADVVILATAYGLQDESVGRALEPYADLPSERLASANSIALIGSGLTMVDVLLSARREGFAGVATIISRRGQLPRAHAFKAVAPHDEDVLPHSKRVSLLEASLRVACEAAEAHGASWQSVINGMRSALQDIWQALSVEEQARFLRHLRPFWDAHRHRLPLQVHARLRQELETGRSVLLRGRVLDVQRGSQGFRLALRRRGSRVSELMRTDLAFDCTGHKPDLGSALIQSLLARGVARADPHRLGLVVAHDGRVLGNGGTPSAGLFALGPLCQGTLWEITSVPEIVRQANLAARSIDALAQPVQEAVALV